MPQAATAAAGIMKVLPSALRTMLVILHPPPPSLICTSCSKFFSSSGNGNLGSCSLSSGAKGQQLGFQAVERLGFCSSMSSIGRLEGAGCGGGFRAGTQERGRRSGEIMCIQQGGGHGARDVGTSLGWQQQQPAGREMSPTAARRLWISTPMQMGRRSAKIATKKGSQDKKKAKLYGRIGKQIVAAVKGGGPNPVSNLALAALLQTAKDYNIPKDIVDRNIKKASDKNQQDFEELTYEVYGFGGVGIVLEVLTDNNNRAAANIRDVVKKSGGKMAEKGSVLFNFKRAGVIVVKASAGTTGDDILLAAMDGGAEDVLEPSSEEDEDDEDAGGDKYYKVLTPVDQFWTITQKLKEEGLPVDTDNSGLELFPVALVKPDDEAEELNRVMMEKLLDLDDVDAVSSTQG